MSGYANYLGQNNTNQATTGWGSVTSAPPAPSGMGMGMGMGANMNANPWGAPAGGANPYLTPDQLYQQLGYYTVPTEVDIDADLLNSYSPVASFLTEQQGLVVLAHLISTVVDHRLKEFFENYMILLMQAEDGSGMFLKPSIEQATEEGARLKSLSDTTVQAEIGALSEHLKTSFVDPGKAVINTHKQAASLAAQSLGIAGLLETAAGGDPNAQGPGALSNIMNWGLHVGTGGLVPRIQPSMMPPPGQPPMTPPPGGV
tara:strand:- start:4128 stop:4901 length:774 start_codon:yes stop_codon:yes gene_type:complete